MSKPDFSKLRAYINSIPSQNAIPGCEISVYYKHEPAFRCVAGYSDREKGIALSGDNIYILYSTSKVITCTAALTLLEEGKFLLSDPLCEYMPEFADMKVKTVNPDGSVTLRQAKNKIKVVDLFTMSAGMTYEYNTPATAKVREESGGRCPTRSFIRALAESPLVFEPGTHWNYSLCHDVLGAFIEVLSGKSFGEYLRERIFEPCGMSDTGFRLSEGQMKRLAGHYRYDDEKKQSFNIGPVSAHYVGSEYESGGAGLYSTVDDYMKFADTLCNFGKTANGERIIGKRTVELMRSNQLDDTRLAEFNWPQLAGYGYGLGVRTLMDGAKGGVLCSRGEFGWGGAAGALVLIDPDSQVTAVYGQHMLNNMEPLVHPRIKNTLYSDIM